MFVRSSLVTSLVSLLNSDSYAKVYLRESFIIHYYLNGYELMLNNKNLVKSMVSMEMTINDNKDEEQKCIEYKKLSVVKKLLIFFCSTDIIFAIILLTYGYSNTNIEHIILDSILMIMLSSFGLLSACLKICCYEMQTIISYFLFITFHFAFTIRILTIDSNSILIIQLIKILQLIVSLILLSFSTKLIYNLWISLCDT